jgi:DNA-binding NarL/FixJ family response regulator
VTASRPVPVAVYSADPILREGVIAQLRGRAEVTLTDREIDGTVALAVADDLDDETIAVCRRMSRDGLAHVVAILTTLDDAALLTGFEAGVQGFIRRNAAVPERLVPVVLAVARGEVSVPPDLVGGLLLHLSRVQASGLSFDPTPDALSDRELDVLRLASEGLETAEIAKRLAYSERTVKGVVHDITTRFQLRNRTHAVAFAMKHGLI